MCSGAGGEKVWSDLECKIGRPCNWCGGGGLDAKERLMSWADVWVVIAFSEIRPKKLEQVVMKNDEFGFG